MNLRQAAEMALEALELTKKSWDWVNPKILDSITTLRAALAEADEPPRREPLTDDEIYELADTSLYDGGKNYGVLSFARAVERAHGIDRLPPVAQQPTWGGLGGDE